MRDAVRCAVFLSAMAVVTTAAVANDLEYYDVGEIPADRAAMSAGGGHQHLTESLTVHPDSASKADSDAGPRVAAADAKPQDGVADAGNAGKDMLRTTGGANGSPSAESLQRTVDTGPDVVEAGPLPKILSDKDARLYERIFDLQEIGRWKQADKLINQLSDRILLGHLLYQRYMHPRRYRARYKELRDWMRKYRDHPGANTIYKLALRRRPKNHTRPPRPKRDPILRIEQPRRDRYAGRTGYHKLSSWKRRYVRTTQRRIRYYIYRGWPKRALRLLNSKKTRRVFDQFSLDESSSVVAGGMFHAGRTKKAFDLAHPAGTRSGEKLPMAHWWAGLAAWRLGKYHVAADHFGAMTQSEQDEAWMQSAAAYWAARGALVTHQPNKVNEYLAIAAKFPRTFYGLLAIRSLGIEPAYDWSLPPMTREAWDTLNQNPKARRALALVQVGETSRAELELKRQSSNLSPQMARMLVTFSVQHNLPSLAVRVGRVLRDRDNELYDAALYPLPEWKPHDGFRIDKALVFAVMRQESRFRIRAKSRAGARGLMQLMPRTAGYMAGRRFRGSRRHQLFDPALNISLGQKYVEHLLEDPNIDGDLFYTVAAYNGGPGNLRKWRRRANYKDDALLFIESIPLSETRDYVERVLTNLWIYRYRLGQPAPSLDAIAAGEWPSYTALDNKPNETIAEAASGL